MHEPSRPGLRERRRRDTQQDVHEAALALFEAQGVRGTTVQQIAERAGISSRTFFRYFSSKEQAAIPGQRRLLEAIEGHTVSEQARAAGLGAVLREVGSAVEAVIAGEGGPDLEDHRRVTRLLASEPDLALLAAAQEQELVVRLRERLTPQLPNAERLAIRVLAEVAVVLWRSSWEEWAETVRDGDAPDPLEVFRRSRETLLAVVGSGDITQGLNLRRTM
ncbi:TetR/AcrR family transcriptional regulator [Sinomonas sp. P10A9]|uniref:TetR/AcrR family transcriptional regulator n=1 Tax=Sinomonas puerhi TaxID=3238584 RepID=A0AB39L4R5_9MICC